MESESATQFSQHIAACQGIIMKICRMYGVDSEDIDDLRQEIFLNAWKSYPQFRGDAKFSTWLYKVALNTAIGRIRKNKGAPLPLAAIHHNVADTVSEKQAQQELLHRLISHLTEQEKALVALYLDELSYHEMAEITGLSENHIGVKLNRVKEKLKKISRYEH